MNLVKAEVGTCDQWVARSAGMVALRTACGKPAILRDTSAKPGEPALYCEGHAPPSQQ